MGFSFSDFVSSLVFTLIVQFVPIFFIRKISTGGIAHGKVVLFTIIYELLQVISYLLANIIIYTLFLQQQALPVWTLAPFIFYGLIIKRIMKSDENGQRDITQQSDSSIFPSVRTVLTMIVSVVSVCVVTSLVFFGFAALIGKNTMKPNISEMGFDASIRDTVSIDPKSILTTPPPITPVYATMEEYIATAEMQQAIESIRSTVDSNLMTVELVGEGNKLIYNFTYQNLDDQDLGDLGDALKKTLEDEDMVSTYRNIAQALKPVVAVDDPVVVVNYRTPDGSLLAGKEYTAN